MSDKPKINVIKNIRKLPNLYKNIGVYCRVSTNSHKQLHSLTQQISYYVKLFHGHPTYRLYDIYIDIGSGNESSERSQYQRMLNDCRNKKLNTIITKSINRFGRNTVEVISAVRELRNLGINIIFESENLDTRDSSNEFLISILSGLAEAENESRRLNIIWGLEKQAKNGTSELYRRRCYGYKKDKIGNLTINESEAETVRFIFSSYIAGKSYKQISKELAENGISSPTGKSTWCNKTIENILSNEKYCSEVILFKNISESKLSGFSSDIIKHRNSYHMIESHPEIISKEDFNLVQELKKKRSRKKPKDSSNVI